MSTRSRLLQALLCLVITCLAPGCGQIRRTPILAPTITAVPTPTLGPPVVIHYYEQLQAGLTQQDVINNEYDLKTLIDAFNFEHPDIKVAWSQDILSQNQVDWFTAITQQKDCFAWNTLYYPAEDLHNLLGLDTFFQSEGSSFDQDFYPQLLAAERQNGILYAIPAASPKPLYIIAYNADLLAKRGLQPPEHNWAFSDLLDLAQKAASPQDGVYGLVDSGWDDMLLRGLSVNWLSQAYLPPGVTFTLPGLTTALLKLKDLTDQNAILFRNYGPQDTGLLAVRAGKAAMWLGLVGDPGGEYFSTQPPGFTIGVAPLPAIAGYSQPLHSEAIPAYYISKTSLHPEQCWQWIKFLTGRATAADGVPARISVAHSADWEARVGLENAQVYRTVLESTQYKTDGPTQIMLESYISTWGDDILRAALNGGDPVKAQSMAQQSADLFLTCLEKANFGQQPVDAQFSLADACFTQANSAGAVP